jgi:hypothetical protein
LQERFEARQSTVPNMQEMLSEPKTGLNKSHTQRVKMDARVGPSGLFIYLFILRQGLAMQPSWPQTQLSSCVHRGAPPCLASVMKYLLCVPLWPSPGDTEMANTGFPSSQLLQLSPGSLSNSAIVTTTIAILLIRTSGSAMRHNWIQILTAWDRGT